MRRPVQLHVELRIKRLAPTSTPSGTEKLFLLFYSAGEVDGDVLVCVGAVRVRAGGVVEAIGPGEGVWVGLGSIADCGDGGLDTAGDGRGEVADVHRGAGLEAVEGAGAGGIGGVGYDGFFGARSEGGMGCCGGWEGGEAC